MPIWHKVVGRNSRSKSIKVGSLFFLSPQLILCRLLIVLDVI